MKYAIGDFVRVKDFSELASKYPIDGEGNIIICDYVFDREMKVYCGEVHTISDIWGDIYKLKGFDEWAFGEEVLELPEERHLREETLQRLKTEIKVLKNENRELRDKLNEKIKAEPIKDEIQDDISEDIKPKKRAYNRKGKA